MIPEIFKDNSLIIKDYSHNAHLGCVLLRMTIGSLIILNKIPSNYILILSLFVIIDKSIRFFKLPNVWKVYSRPVLIYTFVLIFTYLYKEKYNHLSGTLIIVDALMGLQSRHHFDRLGLFIK